MLNRFKSPVGIDCCRIGKHAGKPHVYGNNTSAYGGDSDRMSLRMRTAAPLAATGLSAGAAAQTLGFDILDWAKEGALADLDEIAAMEGWEDAVPGKVLFAYREIRDHRRATAPTTIAVQANT